MAQGKGGSGKGSLTRRLEQKTGRVKQRQEPARHLGNELSTWGGGSTCKGTEARARGLPGGSVTGHGERHGGRRGMRF